MFMLITKYCFICSLKTSVVIQECKDPNNVIHVSKNYTVKKSVNSTFCCVIS